MVPRSRTLKPCGTVAGRALNKAINDCESRVFELKEQEKAGKNTRLNLENEERRAEDLADRLQKRMRQLDEEKNIKAAPPVVHGGLVVIAKGLLRAKPDGAGSIPKGFAEDAEARKKIYTRARCGASIGCPFDPDEGSGNFPATVRNGGILRLPKKKA